MTRWTELTYQLMVHPGEAMTRASRSQAWGIGLLALLAATLSWHISSAILWRGVLPAGPATLVVLLPIRAVLVLVLWIIAAALTHAVARGLKGYGTLSGLFLVLGLATLPFVLLAPLAVLTSAVPGGGVVFFLCLLVLCVWSLVLAVKGVRRVYYLTSGAAAISVLLPWLLLPLAVLGAALIYVTFWLGLSLMSSIASLGQMI